MPDFKADQQPMTGAAALARIYWMILGNLILFFLVILMANRKFDGLAIPSIIYFLIVTSLIVVRHIDIRFLNGTTADDKPATMANWRNYSIIVAVAASCVWVTVLFMARHASQ